MRVAAIDLGTVSSRLLTAEVDGGSIVRSAKRTEITDLGQGVDATGLLSDEAIDRVIGACASFVDEISAFEPDAVCCTLTSAARDAGNGRVLLSGLEGLGLRPQVIPGEVEARLTFYGVAHDFAGERIAVADSGGGSTEFAQGSFVPGEPLEVDGVVSLNIGCRRITDRFRGADRPGCGVGVRASLLLLARAARAPRAARGRRRHGDDAGGDGVRARRVRPRVRPSA